MIKMIKIPRTEHRAALDIFIENTLRMMKLSEALAEAVQQENGWWCIEFPGSDPRMLDHTSVLLLTYGFRLGVEHYHEYRKEMREIAELIAEDAANEAAE